MLDPQAAAVLAELAAQAKPMPSDDQAWLRGYRAELDEVVAMQGPAPAAAVADRWVGALRLRCYRSEGSDTWSTVRPTVLYIHGGGFVAGSLDGYDIPLRHLALRSGWQVAAVDYRLAPEHPHPAAQEDCMAALRDLFAGGAACADPRRIAVAGDSAGGALAALTAHGARAAGLPLRAQVLLYPNADLRDAADDASRAEHDGKVVRLDELRRSLALYAGTADRTALSPLLAADLAGLCPALVVTCECDPLRDEGERYAARLRQAGVAVEAERLGGMIHSVLQRGARVAAGDGLITRVAARLRAIT